MSRGAVVFALPWVCGWACGEPDNLRLLTDSVPEEIAWLALLVQADAGGELIASTALFPPSEAHGLELPSFDRDAAVTTLVGFEDQALRDIPGVAPLSWLEGPLAFEQDSLPPLPYPSWVGLGQLDGSTINVQTSANPTPLRLTAPWLPQCSRDACAFIPTARALEVGLPGARAGASFALPWRAGASDAFVAAHTQFYRADIDGAMELTALSSTSADYRTGALCDDGTIFMRSEGGRIARGRPEEGFTTAGVAIAQGTAEALAPAPQTSPCQLFVATRNGTIEHYDGLDWETLYDAAGPQRDDVGIISLGPQSAIAVFESSNRVVTYEAGSISAFSLPAPNSISNIPGFGIVVGQAFSFENPPDLYVRKDGEWAPIEDLEVGVSQTHRIYPLGDGFVFGGIRGTLTYYHPGLGVCDFPPFTAENILSMATLTNTVIAAADRPTEDQQSVVHVLPFVAPEELPLACVRR